MVQNGVKVLKLAEQSIYYKNQVVVVRVRRKKIVNQEVWQVLTYMCVSHEIISK